MCFLPRFRPLSRHSLLLPRHPRAQAARQQQTQGKDPPALAAEEETAWASKSEVEKKNEKKRTCQHPMQLAVSGRTVLDILCFTPSRYPLKPTTILDSILADKHAGGKKGKKRRENYTPFPAAHDARTETTVHNQFKIIIIKN